MAQISKAYTYKLPDTYFGDTSLEGKTATAIYEGPDKAFVFVDHDGLLHIDEGMHPWNGRAEDKEGMETRAGLSRKLVILDVSRSDDDTLIAAICKGQDLTSWGTKEYILDGETVPYHVDPDPLPVNTVLNIEKIYYDLELGKWKIDEIPFATPVSMADHIQMRDDLITSAEEYISDPAYELKEEEVALINSYIGELQNLYTKYAGIHQAMIPFPKWPIDNIVHGEDQAIAGAEVGPG